jgi:hypothetical protein
MNDPDSPSPAPQPDPVQRIAHHPTSARVPEKISRGIVATGFLAYFGPNEFVVDFLQFIARPPHLAARVIMPPAVAEQFVAVLRENLSRYSAQFGAPPALPKNPQDKPRAAQEIYDDLKIPDEMLCGSYCNAVMVGHTPAEFGIDFITSFIPTAVVSARVYLAAPRIPALIESMTGLLAQFHRQRAAASQPKPPQPPQQPPGFGTAPGIPGFPGPPME